MDVDFYIIGYVHMYAYKKDFFCTSVYEKT